MSRMSLTPDRSGSGSWRTHPVTLGGGALFGLLPPLIVLVNLVLPAVMFFGPIVLIEIGLWVLGIIGSSICVHGLAEAKAISERTKVLLIAIGPLTYLLGPMVVLVWIEFLWSL